jgi:S1-C subfamily serine protease
MTIRASRVLAILLITMAAHAAPQPRALLGMGVSLYQGAGGERFLHVENVTPKGPAAMAGVQPLDIITALNGKKIAFRNEVEFLTYVATLQPGRPIQLQIRRAEKSLRAKLIPGELTPAQREAWLQTFRVAERNASRPSHP